MSSAPAVGAAVKEDSANDAVRADAEADVDVDATSKRTTTAAEDDDAARARIRELRHARTQLAQMLMLLDPSSATAATTTLPSLPPPDVSVPDGPGLAQLLPLLLDPVLQPISQQRQQQHAAAAAAAALHLSGGSAAHQNAISTPETPAARFAGAIRTGLAKAQQLANIVYAPPATASPSAAAADSSPSKEKSTQASNPALTPALKLACDLLQKSLDSKVTPGAGPSAEADQCPANVLLVLRKRKREAENAERAARRQRLSATMRMAETSIATATKPEPVQGTDLPAGGMQVDGIVEGASKPDALRALRFPTPDLSFAAASSSSGLLSFDSLQTYLNALQAHPKWQQRVLAAKDHNMPGTSAPSGFPWFPTQTIRLSVHASALARHLSSFASSIGANSSLSSTSTSAADPSELSSAAILFTIPGLFEAHLTLGTRRRAGAPREGDSDSPTGDSTEVILVSATIRSDPESHFASSASPPDGVKAHSEAHLSSDSPLHRALSADLIAFLARDRRRRRRKSRQGQDVQASSSGIQDDAWHELTLALFFLRGLRTIEVATLPTSTEVLEHLATLPAEPAQGHTNAADGGEGNQNNGQASGPNASDDVLGFVGFLDEAFGKDDSEDQSDPTNSGDVAPDLNSTHKVPAKPGVPFGQAPVRWAWCSLAKRSTDLDPSTGSAAQGSSGENAAEQSTDGEWLAFSLAAAAASAPLPFSMQQPGGLGTGGAAFGWMGPPNAAGGVANLNGGAGMMAPPAPAGGFGMGALGLPPGLGMDPSGLGPSMPFGGGSGVVPPASASLPLPMPMSMPMAAGMPSFPPAIPPVGFAGMPMPPAAPGPGAPMPMIGGMPLPFGGNGGVSQGMNMLDPAAQAFMGLPPLSGPPGVGSVALQ